MLEFLYLQMNNGSPLEQQRMARIDTRLLYSTQGPG
jgi:hypothetical protein